jgi:hypothetical protein
VKNIAQAEQSLWSSFYVYGSAIRFLLADKDTSSEKEN